MEPGVTEQLEIMLRPPVLGQGQVDLRGKSLQGDNQIDERRFIRGSSLWSSWRANKSLSFPSVVFPSRMVSGMRTRSVVMRLSILHPLTRALTLVTGLRSNPLGDSSASPFHPILDPLPGR